MLTYKLAASAERLQLAAQLLKILALFGVIVVISDFLAGNYLVAATALFITLSSPLALLLARQSKYSNLPLYFSVLLLIAMYLIGTFLQFPTHGEKSVWAIMFPFTFFYLTGLQLGTVLSLVGLALMPVAYTLYPYYSSVERIPFYNLSQVMGAFVLSIVLAYKYEQIRSRQEALLKSSAECDPLTGVLNRRGFKAMSKPLLLQVAKVQQPYAILMIDLDNFKQVNDVYGHDAGDQLLQEVASILRMHTRSVDVVARWGGEEFLMLLIQSDIEGALRASETIRAAIADHEFSCGKATASIGVALHDSHEKLDTTIKHADKAMYFAKQKGKNRVSVYTPDK